MGALTGGEILAKVKAGESLRGAYLIEAKLGFADLRGADLSDAYLMRANLQDAILWGRSGAFEVNLTNAHLDGADLRGAEYNDVIKWPEGFDPKAAGAKRVAKATMTDWIPFDSRVGKRKTGL